MRAAAKFIRTAQALPANITDDHVPASRQSGAIRRASMDLTRALADLRRRGE